MYRKITGFLTAWKESKHRKPLILQGARQVGKTYSILEFGKNNYENVAYFNFKNKSAEILTEWVNNSCRRFPGKRGACHLQEIFQEDFHSEVSQG